MEEKKNWPVITLYVFVGILGAIGAGLVLMVPWWLLANIISPDKITYLSSLNSIISVAVFSLTSMTAVWWGSEIYKRRN